MAKTYKVYATSFNPGYRSSWGDWYWDGSTASDHNEVGMRNGSVYVYNILFDLSQFKGKTITSANLYICWDGGSQSNNILVDHKYNDLATGTASDQAYTRWGYGHKNESASFRQQYVKEWPFVVSTGWENVAVSTELPDYGYVIGPKSNTTGYNRRYIDTTQTPYLIITTDETEYTLTFDANGGTSAPAAQTLTGMDSATGTITMAVPVRDNHIFKGWATSATATVAQYQPGDTITISANTTLYAVWAVSSVIRVMTADGLKQGQVYVQTADGMKLGIVYVQTQNGLIQSN